jgi:polar amino acid transport system ATP-binding protein
MSVVKLTSVRKSYGAVEVLKGIDMEVEKGQVLALLGRSGSGKSTVLRCLNGLEKINAGKITVNGQALAYDDKSLRELRRKVGFVFQSFNLFPHLTVERNITVGLTVVQKMPMGQAREIADHVLKQVDLAEKKGAYPDQLSGGQQQRVAIARCLALSPSVILFDEVTSALDPELKSEVLKVIADLAKQGMTMVLVTHEMNFARHVADIVVFMHQGKVCEVGRADQIFEKPQTPEFRSFLKTEAFNF